MTGQEATGLQTFETRTLNQTAGDGRAHFLSVVSGKGGVGKTNLVANLAVAAAGLRARVLIIDGDLGLANLDVLLGLAPLRTLADVLAGRCSVAEALVAGPRGVMLLPAASGRSDLAGLSRFELDRLLREIDAVASRFDLILIDAGAGVGAPVVALAAASARTLLLTTAEPTSLADAYATLKVLKRGVPGLRVELIVNEVTGELEARSAHSQLERMTKRFLKTEIFFRGFLPRDPHLMRAVARQRAVVEAFPTAASSRKFVELADQLLRTLRKQRAGISNGMEAVVARGESCTLD